MCWTILLLLLVCYIYIWITWKSQCKKNRMLPRKGKIDVVNLGSTYAYYDLDYSDLNINAYNLANIPQYLDYDTKLLEIYVKYICPGGKVLIVLPNFVFIGNETKDDKKVYYEALYPWEIKTFQLRKLVKYVARAALEPITHKYKKEETKWKGHVSTYEEKVQHAERRIKDWVVNLGIPSVQTDEITEELVKKIEENKNRVCNMIDLCKKNEIEPIIIIPPVSEIMKERVSSICINRYLKQPIQEIKEKKEVRVFDYMEEKEFEESDLYMNSDCLNERGRKVFTLKVLRDLGICKKL